MKKVLMVFILGLITQGCTAVKPWERGNLATVQMQWETNVMQASFEHHVYTSKEASTGGTSVAGGGCGCN